MVTEQISIMFFSGNYLTHMKQRDMTLNLPNYYSLVSRMLEEIGAAEAVTPQST